MLKHPDFPGTATAEAPEEELEDQGASGGGGFLGCWVFSFTLLHLCHRRRKSSPLIRSWVLSTLNFYFEASLQLHIYKECLPILAQKQHCPAPPPLVPAFQKCHPWDSLVSTRSLAKKLPALADLLASKVFLSPGTFCMLFPCALGLSWRLALCFAHARWHSIST